MEGEKIIPRFVYYFILDYLLDPKRPIGIIFFGVIGFVMVIAPSKVSSFKDAQHIKTLRSFGVIMVLISLILGIVAVQINAPERVEHFHNMVTMHFKELHSPYDLKFTRPYKAELRYPERSERVLKISARQVSDQSYRTVAEWLLMQAQIYFQKENREAKENKTVSIKSEPPRQLESPGEETLEQADRLLQEAGRSWEANDFENSLKKAEEALRIKTKILGIGHPDVIRIEQQISAVKVKLQQRK